VARDEKLDLLRRVPLFESCDRRHLERIGQLADELDVTDGTVLMRQGDMAHDLMIVVDGRVRLERDGKPLGTMEPGDFFGEIALIAEGRRTATATADGNARLLVVSHREFHALMDEFPGVAREVLLALARRIQRLEPTALQ
jgi:CRP/FNR family transcriptional regulator, cyclic AMP receptor protein